MDIYEIEWLRQSLICYYTNLSWRIPMAFAKRYGQYIYAL